MLKNRVVVVSAVFGFLLTYLVTAKTASAFWLFDLFRGGEVKGETTVGTTTKSIPDYVKNVVRKIKGENSATPTPTPKVASEDQGEVSEERINQLVKTGKISEAQKAELLAKLNAIKVKRAELKALQMELVAWLKNHRIETEATPTVKVSPSVKPTLRITLPVTPEAKERE